MWFYGTPSLPLVIAGVLLFEWHDWICFIGRSIVKLIGSNEMLDICIFP